MYVSYLCSNLSKSNIFILIGKLISTFVEFLSFCFDKFLKKDSLLKV